MCKEQVRQGVIQPDTQEKISLPIYEIYMIQITRNATICLNKMTEG